MALAAANQEEFVRTRVDIPDSRTGGTPPGAILPIEGASSLRGIPRRTESRQAVLEGFGGVGEPCPPLCGEVGDRPLEEGPRKLSREPVEERRGAPAYLPRVACVVARARVGRRQQQEPVPVAGSRDPDLSRFDRLPERLPDFGAEFGEFVESRASDAERSGRIPGTINFFNRINTNGSFERRRGNG